MAATSVQQLNSELEIALKKYILERDHIRTGALYKSVRFNCSDSGELLIRYSAKFYIQYLEHRQFVDDFFKLQSTTDILSNYIAYTIEQDLIK